MSASIEYEQLIRSDAIIVTDRNGTIALWNPASERMFEFTRSEAMGQSLNLIIPQRLQQRHGDGYQKTMETGETRYAHDLLRVPAVHRMVAPCRSPSRWPCCTEQHDVTGIAAVIRDETVRFNEERSLRKRLAELEAQVSK